MLFPTAMFDEDVFFSLHLSSRTSATKMYAVEYCEVAVLQREEALRVLDRFPYVQELYARQVQRQRWRVWVRVERFDWRGTEPFEPFEPFERFEFVRNWDSSLENSKISENFNIF